MHELCHLMGLPRSEQQPDSRGAKPQRAKETYWTQGAFDAVVGRLQLNLTKPCVTLGRCVTTVLLWALDMFAFICAYLSDKNGQNQ